MQNRAKIYLGVASLLLVIGLIGLALFSKDIYEDMQHKIILTDEITVYENSDFYLRDTKKNNVLKKEFFIEEISVKRIIYGKDYMAVEIVIPGGAKGWIFYGDNFQLIRIRPKRNQANQKEIHGHIWTPHRCRAI